MRSDSDFQDYMTEAREYLWEEIEPHAEEWDKTGNLPRTELWSELQEQGFLGARVPEEFGGLGLNHTEYVQLEKEWAKVSGGLRVILHVHNLGAEIVNAGGTDEQRERILPQIAEDGLSVAFALTEPHSGTGRDIETTAERDGDEYVLNGAKHHITNSFAEYINVVARNESGFSNVLVPRDAKGLTITEMPELMGSLGSDHGYAEFDDCIVPAENILGEEGEGLQVVFQVLAESRLHIAANALGISERCFEASLDWAKKRVTFDEPIAERQAIQQYLAEMARDLYSLRLAVEDTARTIDEEGHAGVKPNLCKLLSRDVNQKITDTAMLIHGGLGYYREFPIQRLYRDARLNWLEEGTPTIQKISTSKQLLNGVLPYETDPQAAQEYNLGDYDSTTGNDYTLSYEIN